MLEAFRSTFPENKLQLEATKQIAYAYRESGELSHAAGEYDRIASQSEDPALRSEALLDAGDLYSQSNSRDRALDAYIRYVKEFPKPVETAIETRFKIAEMYKDEPRRDALSQAAGRNRKRRRGRRAGKDRPDPDDRGTFGAGPRRAALRGFRGREAAATLRDQPAG